MIVIQSHNHTPDSALALIRSERAYIHPNQSYIEQLEVYHESGCDASSAAQKWTQRQAELADTKRKTRMNPVFFFAHARLRLLNWIHRKVRWSPPEENGYERVRTVETDTWSCWVGLGWRFRTVLCTGDTVRVCEEGLLLAKIPVEFMHSSGNYTKICKGFMGGKVVSITTRHPNFRISTVPDKRPLKLLKSSSLRETA